MDFIGDIHGHADKFIELLEKLSYSSKNVTYSHPMRKVLFIGDYIDRGPKIRENIDNRKANGRKLKCNRFDGQPRIK